ncbi:hypothetical protein GCM10011409_19190 [Lentibacillus populi]|uniref:Uncharacterized protein n=1 Tax=Lentibacillus populi TaxID=1827502 RepID=A0A9W5X5D2_9BACI|nr:DUF2977 domain-containing protein [Lentibacillus populi]GGB41797.1 hypothetical protein GCM10011409_19190 [Lentibacillus populi]
MVKIYFVVDDNNYISGGLSYGKMEGAIELEVPDNHEIFKYDANVFKYENGKLIKDEEYQKQLIAEEEEKQNLPSDEEMNAIALMELTELIMGR